MENVHLLYADNAIFLNRAINSPVNSSEIRNNVYAQTKKAKKIIAVRHIPQSVFLFFFGIVTLIKGAGLINEVIAFYSISQKSESIDYLRIVFGILVVFLFLAVAYVSLRTSVHLLYANDMDSAVKLTDKLLKKHKITVGTVIKVINEVHVTIYYTFTNDQGTPVTSEFETASTTLVKEDSKVFVLYNNNYSVLL